jgi:hypothetical protein
MAGAERQQECRGNLDQHAEEKMVNQVSPGINVANLHEMEIEPEAEHSRQHGQDDQQQSPSCRQGWAGVDHDLSSAMLGWTAGLRVVSAQAVSGFYTAGRSQIRISPRPRSRSYLRVQSSWVVQQHLAVRGSRVVGSTGEWG